ncbi:MAG: ATP-binding protein [Acidobacteriota bacterium]
MADRRTVEFNFRSDLACAEIAVNLCCSFTHRCGFDEAHCSDICLALREALNNAILHGNRRSPEKQVRVRLSGEPGRILLSVQDQGSGFNPRNLPDPTKPENLLKPCGRGIFLMRNFMEHVAFRFSRRGGTEVRLDRKLDR